MKTLHVFTLTSTAKAFFNGQFKYLTDHGHEIHVVASPGNMEEFCKTNKVEYIQIEIARKIDFKRDIKSILMLSQLIKKEKYDMIVGHTPKGALLAMIAGKLCSIPRRVYYRHGLIYTTAKGLKRKVLILVERLTASIATKIINVSHSLSSIANRENLNKSQKQEIIGSGTCGGIDTKNLFNPKTITQDQQISLKKKLKINNNEKIIGFCGRICKDKGIEELIEGFKLFNKRNPTILAKLIIIGNYDQRDIIKPSVKKEIESNYNIIRTGHIPHEELPLYYSLMSIFILPSYREGFNTSVIEASAMEVPVLVSKSHGCIDTIIETETGEYIDITPKGICDGIELILSDRNTKCYGYSGRKWVTENFDHSVMWPKILALYDRLENELNCKK